MVMCGGYHAGFGADVGCVLYKKPVYQPFKHRYQKQGSYESARSAAISAAFIHGASEKKVL